MPHHRILPPVDHMLQLHRQHREGTIQIVDTCLSIVWSWG